MRDLVVRVTFAPISVPAEILLDGLAGHIDAGVSISESRVCTRSLLHHLVLRLDPLADALEHDLIGWTGAT